MGNLRQIILVVSCLFLASCATEKDADWIPLWNGEDFSGWHSYLDTLYQRKTDESGNKIEPYGVDNDPLGVFSVVQLDDGPAIRIDGKSWGMIYTKESYRNYHLKLKFKWGEGRYEPRAEAKRDSGLLYHGFGGPGSAYQWMNSQELQIQEGDTGDYWPVGDVEVDIPSKKYDEHYYIYDKRSDLRTYFSSEYLPEARDESLSKRRCIKGVDAERPFGEWNEIDLICLGDQSIHIVNGVVVMRLYHSKNVGSESPQSLDSGRLILQSEGAEIFFKDIVIKQIDAIPETYSES